jgi:hypothetical protein
MLMTRNFLIFTLLLIMIVPVNAWSTKSSYKQILKEWTRDDEAYSWGEIEARLVWHATYFSPDFREAKVERYAKLYQLKEGEVERLRAEEMADSEKFDSFFVAIYAGSRIYPDIGKDRSLWKLVLETSEGDSIQPAMWEEIPKNQVTRTLFPYIDRWSRLFEVKFPKSIKPSTARAQLKMVGVPANSTLEWNFNRARHSALQK